MKEISLTRGAVTIVDDKDYHMLIAIGRWSLNSHGYAIHHQNINGKRKNLLIHRIIMNAPPHLQVDHINRDKLDNRRSNLRFATRSQNQANKSIASNNTSSYKGVVWSRSKWEARIRYHGERIYLGQYDDPMLAAQVYDGAALALFKDFAGRNFPDKAVDREVQFIVRYRLDQWRKKNSGSH